MAREQLDFGVFQDVAGNPLALGYLTVRLNKDAVTATGDQISAGIVVTVPLNADGFIAGAAMFWPNNQLTPTDTVYIIKAYTARGQFVWEYQTGTLPTNNFLLQESGPLILQENGFGILIT